MMSASARGLWLLACCCLLVASKAQQDSVLRFLSRDQMARVAQKAKGPGTDDREQLLKLKQEVKCGDGMHSCPDGYTCDTERGQCTSESLGVVSLPSSARMEAGAPAANKTCPDKKTICHQNDTCCNATVGYGCCPLPFAVCCQDKVHCCPARTVCDMARRRCYGKLGWEQPWVEKVPAVQTPPLLLNQGARSNGVICPDGQMCSDGNTCCLLTNGSYGCCSFADAVCCSDHVHCCPHGYVCNYTRQGCVKGRILRRWSHIQCSSGSCRTQVDSLAVKGAVTDVICQGNETSCPDGTTCCKLATGQWGCCPQPNAVCCSDGIHCCPQGTTCDLSAGTCTLGDTVVPWDTKKPARKVEDVICPDAKSSCPNDTTCCKTNSGMYGCCPLPKAVCCSDHIHCCPSGTTCDVSAGTCISGIVAIPWETKQPARPAVKGVICPDQNYCPDGTTCCMLPDGSYGCCPYPEAVCCKDKKHCCPKYYTCNLAAGKCDKGHDSVPMLAKQPPVSKSPSNTKCRDGTQCSSGQTCCLTKAGGYGCCPVPNATCCSDHVHCCPSGYKCNVAAGTCERETELTPIISKTQPALRAESVVCPDKKSMCADDQTCCKMASGEYGCCPQPRAVCCKDHLHCCPEGYTCDTSAGTCMNRHLSLPWESKQPAVPSL